MKHIKWSGFSHDDNKQSAEMPKGNVKVQVMNIRTKVDHYIPVNVGQAEFHRYSKLYWMQVHPELMLLSPAQSNMMERVAKVGVDYVFDTTLHGKSLRSQNARSQEYQ